MAISNDQRATIDSVSGSSRQLTGRSVQGTFREWARRSTRWFAACKLAILVVGVMVLGVSTVQAQNPIRGVIRPVPGSKPLAIRTPTVGLAPNPGLGGNVNAGLISGRGSGHYVNHPGHFHPPVYQHSHTHHHHGFRYGYSRPLSYIGWGTYPVGVSINFGRRYRSVGVSYGYPGFCYGGGWGYRTIYSSYSSYWPAYSATPYLGSPYYVSPNATLDSYLLHLPRFAGGAAAPGADERLAPPAEAKPAIAASDRSRPPRASSASGIRRAMRSISTGDDLFRRGEYLRAQSNYRNAVRYAPDLALAHLHYGFSLVATSKYKQAAGEFKTAIDYDPQLVNAEWRLNDMYDDPAIMHEHLDGLADYALRHRRHTDLLFAVGVCLHYIGERERAIPFFDKTLENDQQWEFAANAFVEANDVAIVDADEPPVAAVKVDDEPVLRLGVR